LIKQTEINRKKSIALFEKQKENTIFADRLSKNQTVTLIIYTLRGLTGLRSKIKKIICKTLGLTLIIDVINY